MTTLRMMSWDSYFLRIANEVRGKSKDPSTKVGAVIVGTDNQILSTGYNGFPRGVIETIPERWERPIKYKYVEHAERNAIYNAARHGVALRGATLYIYGMGPPTYPCTDCARAVIQAGLTVVVGCAYKEAPDTWLEDFKLSELLLREGDVAFREVSLGAVFGASEMRPL